MESETVRERSCAAEHMLLASGAAFADESRGRLRLEAECPIRTSFQRDRDRIIHSSSFRRLKHKTQVFLSPEGDHYRTRLTHTLEVAQIARTMAVGLRLNQDLTEAIALGHDLGHTPFGHAGERALDSVCTEGFQHYTQSLRVVDFLEKEGKGLNLTFEVRNGIERHTCGDEAATLEGRIVRLADRVAYINHDIDDACRADIMREEDIPKHLRDILGHSKSKRINTLVVSVIENSGDNIALAVDIQKALDELHRFMFEKVYTNSVCKGEETKAVDLIKWLYFYFVNNPDKLPDLYKRMRLEHGIERAACDYIAGMSDRFAVGTFEGLFIPKSWMY